MKVKGKDLSHIPLCIVTNEEEIDNGFKYKVGKNTNKYGLHFVACEDVFHPDIIDFGNGYRKITVDDDEDIKCYDNNYYEDEDVIGRTNEYGEDIYVDNPITFSAKSITLLPGKQKFSDITDEKEVIKMVTYGYYNINKNNWYNTKICRAALTNSYTHNKNLYDNYFSEKCRNDISIIKKLKDSGVDVNKSNNFKVFLSKIQNRD